MVEPVIVRREAHNLSRRDIDPDALKVLYRLREHGFTAYLVGGSVRDLLLGRRPKDFDIGTDAHPYQIKRLFRNCWIIGRRFRLAHVKFGTKTIEVATFRRIVTEPARPDDEPVVADATPSPGGLGPLSRDNTFGTPEEDAFRRDFTINGLFYDIGTFSVIDYVGGLDDLEKRVVRSIGDPSVRFVEDPVRMLRAIVMASRLGFDLDPLVTEAIAEHRGLIASASPARLLEEYFKILRAGAAEATFRALARARLLELVTPELQSPPDALWDALARLDRYRQRFTSAPDELTTPLLLGSLLQPLGVLSKPLHGRGASAHADRVSFGILPVARRDLERLRQITDLAPRLIDPGLPPRVVRSLPHRPAFADAVTWLDIHAEAPDVVETWRQVQHRRVAPPHGEAAEGLPDEGAARPSRRRRRRRRRRRSHGPEV
ncbi:MAG: polynucleotide adenylyltransferase PcnB [Acidobacteria bacterium]|nr:polynucleotide adenylyltransferase PcnB [Acidobacteriota bacterium]